MAVVAVVLALLVGYVQRAAVNSDQFANRATAALHDDSVRSLLARRVTDDLVLASKPDLQTARPLIQSVVASAVASPAFTGLFRAGVRDVHRSLFDRDAHTLTLTVADAGIVAAAALDAVQPAVAQRVRTNRRIDLLTRNITSAGADAARIADTVRVLAWLLLALAVGCTAGAVALAGDRRRAVVRLGAGVALVALVIVVALGVARGAAVDHVQGADARDAAAAVWDAFLGDLSTAALILAGMGVVVAAAAASLIRPADIRAPLRRAGAWVIRKPALLVLAGVLCVLEPTAVIRLVVRATGLFLIYAGLSTILWRINEPRIARPAAPPARRRRGLVAAGIAIALIAVAAGTFAATGGTTTAAPRPVACNDHAELCDRPLNAVALAATHNSMSAPLPGWFSTQQDASIPDQLHDGIHGLLIDTHYADRLPNGRLRTDLDARQLRSQAQADGVSPEAVDAALRIRDRLGFAGKGTRGMYLCHSFCELGGTPLHSVLQDLDDFLVANPGEVLVVVNEDYVSPGDFVGAVQQADLERFVYRGPTSGRWPTLRQMIDSNERLVMLAENKAGAAPWYHLAYDAITQETPFSFRRPAKLTEPSQIPASCRPNRGPSGAPMFLVNHWITTDPAPKPSNARVVNAYSALLDRLQTCRRIRHHIPNLVAVDFYRQGDVFKAVDALNGVG